MSYCDASAIFSSIVHWLILPPMMATLSRIPSDDPVSSVSDTAFFHFAQFHDSTKNILGVNQGLFFINKPNSFKADQTGIATGEFIARNADLAKKLENLRAQLMEKVTDVRISITYFQNWGYTDAALLLHAKPTTREQVVSLVTAARSLEIKVAICMMFVQCCKSILTYILIHCVVLQYRPECESRLFEKYTK